MSCAPWRRDCAKAHSSSIAQRSVPKRLARQAASCSPAGVEFLDCPVSGGVEGAEKGTLAIMVGGSPEAFAQAQPILNAMGKTVTHFGPTGSGQAAKATNQIMCAGIIECVAEAMAFARAQGLPLDKVVDTLGKGAGSSWYFVHRGPNMVRGCIPRRLPRPPAREGPGHLPRHGRSLRCRTTGR